MNEMLVMFVAVCCSGSCVGMNRLGTTKGITITMKLGINRVNKHGMKHGFKHED